MSVININQAVEKLLAGEIIGVPTESVYGLSVDARNKEAVENLIKLKGRDSQKGFIIIVSEINILENLGWIKILSPEDKNKLKKTWPGPVTYLLPSLLPGAPLPRVGEGVGERAESGEKKNSLTGQHETLAVRISAHPVLLKLSQKLKIPIVSTSANPQGLAPAKNLDSFFNYFGKDFPVLSGELGGLEKPTPIFDLSSGRQLR